MRIHLETRKARKAGAPRVASEAPELDDKRSSANWLPRLPLPWRSSRLRRALRDVRVSSAQPDEGPCAGSTSGRRRW